LLKNKELWDLNNPDLFMEKQQFQKFFKDKNSFINDCVKQITLLNPRTVGFSLYMSTIHFSSLLAEKIKKINPDITIIGGGPECKRLGGNFLQDTFFDIFILGEAEHSLAKVLRRIKRKKSLRDVSGLLIKKGNEVFFTRKDSKLKDLTTLPLPDYSDFDIDKYTECVLPISMSRGCINSCTFCADTYIWGAYRFRKAESVVSEIKRMLKNYDHHKFVFIDSTLNGDIKEFEKLCDLIIKEKLDIKWSAKMIPRKEMTLELLRKIKKSGCEYIAYGVESGSQKVVDEMRKRTDLEDVKRVLKDTYSCCINTCCFLIIGYPTETEEDFQKTLEFIRKNHKYVHMFNQVTGCHIENNSYLGKNLDKYSIVFKKDGWYSPNSTPEIRKNRLSRVKKVLQECYPELEIKVQQ